MLAVELRVAGFSKSSSLSSFAASCFGGNDRFLLIRGAPLAEEEGVAVNGSAGVAGDFASTVVPSSDGCRCCAC